MVRAPAPRFRNIPLRNEPEAVRRSTTVETPEGYRPFALRDQIFVCTRIIAIHRLHSAAVVRQPGLFYENG